MLIVRSHVDVCPRKLSFHAGIRFPGNYIVMGKGGCKGWEEREEEVKVIVSPDWMPS